LDTDHDGKLTIAEAGEVLRQEFEQFESKDHDVEAPQLAASRIASFSVRPTGIRMSVVWILRSLRTVCGLKSPSMPARYRMPAPQKICYNANTRTATDVSS